MKLPEVFQQFLNRKPEKKEMFLSLLLDVRFVQAALWDIEKSGKARVGHVSTEAVVEDSWESRGESCDRAIAVVAQQEQADVIEKVVLGFPSHYLSSSDDIDASIRPKAKKLTEELELTPIGFVPLHQAILHMLKVDEGVPPSVILVGVSEPTASVVLYKVGNNQGQKTIEKENIAVNLEVVLKSFKELEVLPSRILLWGFDGKSLETVKQELLKHPWPTRANFLHYPKIDILPTHLLGTAVSLAGASELAMTIQDEPEEQSQSNVGEGGETARSVHKDQGVASEEIPVEDTQGQKEGIQPRESFITEEIDENIALVEPESLGFKRDVDVLEESEEKETIGTTEEISDRGQHHTPEENPLGKKQPRFIIRNQLASFFRAMRVPAAVPIFLSGGFPRLALPLIGLVLLCGIVAFSLVWFFPHATIILYEVPYSIQEAGTVAISPTATVVDSQSKTIPGKKQERSVSGEKTIAVSGKKAIGDPSKGTAVIYNKSLSSKTFKKGTILTVGSLQFTLDTDVSVASASESIGSITFGKAPVAVTAFQIGSQSNLPAGTEFAFKDTGTALAVARNDQPLTGGTSKQVTVVSRADYDALVKSLTEDLVIKAKTELAGSVSGSERLIDDTIKTTVTEKQFSQELDQEATELHGKLTVNVSGISYNDTDVGQLFQELIGTKVPTGYVLSEKSGGVTASNIQVKKDGSIGAVVSYRGIALPTLDMPVIKKALVGKRVPGAVDYAKGVTGVGGISIRITRSLWKDKIPSNARNITIAAELLE